MNVKRYIPIFIVAALVIAIQLAVTLTGQVFYLTQLTMAAYYTVVVVGLCMLMGYAGQISLGHAGFFAIGGYTSATLTTADFSGTLHGPAGAWLVKTGCLTIAQDVYGSTIARLSPWVACIAAVLTTVVIAYIIGAPVLRLKGHYLAMATLGFGSIISKIVVGTKIFGGADGISGVPPFMLTRGFGISGNITARIPNYYVAWGMVIVAALLMHNLVHSRAGRGLRAIHGNEEAARAMGIDTARYKLNLFVISAVFASVAGIFLTHYNGGIGPSEASIMKSVRYVAIVAVGGMANLWGVIAAGSGLNFLSLRGYFGSYDEAVFGIVLTAMMLFAPQGILAGPGWLSRLTFGRKRAAKGEARGAS